MVILIIFLTKHFMMTARLECTDRPQCLRFYFKSRERDGPVPHPNLPKGGGTRWNARKWRNLCVYGFFLSQKASYFCTKFGHSMQNIGKIVIVDFLKLCASDRGKRRRICFYLVATDSPRLAAYTKHTLRTPPHFVATIVLS